MPGQSNSRPIQLQANPTPGQSNARPIQRQDRIAHAQNAPVRITRQCCNALVPVLYGEGKERPALWTRQFEGKVPRQSHGLRLVLRERLHQGARSDMVATGPEWDNPDGLPDFPLFSSIFLDFPGLSAARNLSVRRYAYFGVLNADRSTCPPSGSRRV